MPKTNLPIDQYLVEINESFNSFNNLILTAPPGTGKTTRVPPSLLNKFKKIIILVPKRIAAISAANRIAEENNWILGQQVGYQVRFESITNADSKLIFMTEGVFIKKLQDSKMWQNLDLIIFDEFHERSSLLDLALGFTLEKQILEQNVNLLIMSATLDTAPLQSFLSNGTKIAKHIHVVTPIYPLEIIKSKKPQRLIVDIQFTEHLTETLRNALIKSQKDILIFLPGLAEINYVKKHLLDNFKNIEVDVLHGSINLDEQKKIIHKSLNNNSKRRIILSTNIAESSLTLPSIDCIIDSGLVKKSVRENKIGFKKLETVRISHFSAQQRAGRASRIGPGYCFQLWHNLDERSMPDRIEPQILNSDLLEECLTLIALGINNPDHFSWLDKPKSSFQQVLKILEKWGLTDLNKGLLVQSTPLDIEKGLLFVELSLAGMQKKASKLLAYLETTNFDKLTAPIDLENIQLNEMGIKIENQLNRISVKQTIQTDQSFKELLINLFFKYFPNKIAKRKEKNIAISSLGRGIELSSYLLNVNAKTTSGATSSKVASRADYFLLLSGRELSSALTKCDFAIDFTAEEFEKFSSKNIQKHIEVDIDFERNKLFKIEKTMAGFFTISTASKTFIDEKQEPALFQKYLKINFLKLLNQHPDYKNYSKKINFLKNKTSIDFNYLAELDQKIYDSISGTIKTIDDFFKLNLYDVILFSTPENLLNDLQQLPNQFRLPNGKTVNIDYETEQAPKISVRIQDLFGQNTNPTILNGRINITLELLAPNYRPTQITSQLESFWKTSYFEIKKELKARYPKHPWPDDPANFKHAPKKHD